MISVKISNIPMWLRCSEFYKSLDEEDDTPIEVPIDCFPINNKIHNVKDFIINLKTYDFWQCSFKSKITVRDYNFFFTNRKECLDAINEPNNCYLKVKYWILLDVDNKILEKFSENNEISENLRLKNYNDVQCAFGNLEYISWYLEGLADKSFIESKSYFHINNCEYIVQFRRMFQIACIYKIKHILLYLLDSIDNKGNFKKLDDNEKNLTIEGLVLVFGDFDVIKLFYQKKKKFFNNICNISEYTYETVVKYGSLESFDLMLHNNLGHNFDSHIYDMVIRFGSIKMLQICFKYNLVYHNDNISDGGTKYELYDLCKRILTDKDNFISTKDLKKKAKWIKKRYKIDINLMNKYFYYKNKCQLDNLIEYDLYFNNNYRYELYLDDD